MDLSLLNSHQQVIRGHNNEKKAEPEQLFQESWFFGNLLQTSYNKPKTMLRSFSDPITSSSSSYKSYGETYKSIKKVSLMSSAEKGIDLSIRRSESSSSSLATEEEEEEYDQDEEVEFSMGELIRQASMKSSDSCSFNPKVLTPSSRQRSVNKHELDIITNTEEGSEDVIPQVPMKQLQPQKSLTTTLKSEELQGFKDLGFEFDQLYLNSATTISIPNNNSRVKNDRDSEKNIKRSWCHNMHSSAPPVLKWGATSSEIMKEQIKFWARAVAYNVRQEC